MKHFELVLLQSLQSRAFSCGFKKVLNYGMFDPQRNIPASLFFGTCFVVKGNEVKKS